MREKVEPTPKSAETPSVAKPRSKKLVIIGIVVIVLIVVGGVGVYYLFYGGTPITIWDTNGVCQNISPPGCGFRSSTGSPTLNVNVNSKVTWTNTGGQAHTATSCDPIAATANGSTACPTVNGSSLPAFDSNSIGAGGGTYSFTFSQKGTYYFFCKFHPWMHGTVNVQ